jgi:hypothetical protein
MIRHLRRVASLGLPLLIAIGPSVGLAAVPASAVTSPADNYAQGYVGLCNKQGQNITSGSVYDKPFVWRAVGSVAAPTPFNSSSRKATLYAFQPRPGVDASEWSGTNLTAATHYTNPSVPMAQATHRDLGLSDYLNDYPPEVSGVVELRLFYSAADTGFSTSYAASFIQVHGTSWTLIKGGTVNCTAGRATSPETQLPKYDKAGQQPPQLLSVVAAKSVGAPTSRSANLAARDAALHDPGPTPSTSATPSVGSDHPSSSSTGAAGSAAGPGGEAVVGGSGGSSAGLIAIGIAVAIVIVGGGLFWWKRGTRPSG